MIKETYGEFIERTFIKTDDESDKMRWSDIMCAAYASGLNVKKNWLNLEQAMLASGFRKEGQMWIGIQPRYFKEMYPRR